MLNGVGGNHHVTQGGTVRYEVFNNKGQIVVLQTYAYFDPRLHLRLFSPQSFLDGLREKGGSFVVKDNGADLILPDGDIISMPIDPHTFLLCYQHFIVLKMLLTRWLQQPLLSIPRKII